MPVPVFPCRPHGFEDGQRDTKILIDPYLCKMVKSSTTAATGKVHYRFVDFDTIISFKNYSFLIVQLFYCSLQEHIHGCQLIIPQMWKIPASHFMPCPSHLLHKDRDDSSGNWHPLSRQSHGGRYSDCHGNHHPCLRQ
jgi:hypothetical protein